MATVSASAERLIAATPEEVYRLLVDYRGGRPRILPEAYADYRVEEGGVGAGTVVSYTLHAAKRERRYRLEVTEPEPGRVLAEADVGSTFRSTWTVAPSDGGSRVRVESSWRGAGGIGGFFEKTFAPKGLGRLYDSVLDRVEAEVGRG